jgi:hypothetical protein
MMAQAMRAVLFANTTATTKDCQWVVLGLSVTRLDRLARDRRATLLNVLDSIAMSGRRCAATEIHTRSLPRWN